MKTEGATVLISAKTELLVFVKIVVKTRVSVKTAPPLFGKIATLLFAKIGKALTALVLLTENDLFKGVIATIEDLLFKGRIEVVTAPPDRGIEVGEAAVSFTKADSPVVAAETDSLETITGNTYRIDYIFVERDCFKICKVGLFPEAYRRISDPIGYFADIDFKAH